MDNIKQDSLLVNVSKYAASDKKLPLENFVTEAFAWLLRNDEDARMRVAELMQEKCNSTTLSDYDIAESVNISTQVNFGGVFPDMVWAADNKTWHLVFEHKVWAELHENQLGQYRDYANTHLNNPLIILITANKGQHQQNPDVALCWYEIAEVLTNTKSPDETLSWYRKEFLTLLDNYGLLNYHPINPLSLAYYNEVKQIDKCLNDICQSTLSESWPVSESSRFTEPKTIKVRWGRIGYDLYTPKLKSGMSEDWAPGLFCGFINDAYDHVIPDLLENGPIATVILSVDRSLFSCARNSQHYKQLVVQLSEKLISSGSQWQVSDRKIHASYNQWHPLIIYCELGKLLQGTTKLEEQTARFYQQASQVQRCLLACPSFELFCDELIETTKL